MDKVTHPHHPRPHSSAPAHHLDLRVREIGQLFNSMDPTPFLNKDLDPAAEAFIEGWALQFPPESRLSITIHLDRLPPDTDANVVMTEAIHNHFRFKVGLTQRELRLLMQMGRRSLLAGFVFVSICLIAAQSVDRLGASTAITIARESLTIVGWVSMWRPMEIFLYDWWPLARRIRLYKTLTHAHVSVVEVKRATAPA